jgi:hypothetical protein
MMIRAIRGVTIVLSLFAAGCSPVLPTANLTGPDQLAYATAAPCDLITTAQEDRHTTVMESTHDCHNAVADDRAFLTILAEPRDRRR